MNKPFKTCTICGHRWEHLSDLVRDENLYINGYQASLSHSQEGFFLLTHTLDHCGTTIAVPATHLRPLYAGPHHNIKMAFTERCRGHCFYEDPLCTCGSECDMRWARDIVQILKSHGSEELFEYLKKNGAPVAA